jgi:hypothetical protein
MSALEPLKRGYSVAKAPLRNMPAEQRSRIASELLEAYGAGEQIADLAPRYNISDVTAYAILLRDHEKEWQEAQIARGIARKASAYADLDAIRQELHEMQVRHANGELSASDALSLARIREQTKLAETRAKRAEWELERIYKRVYGQDASPSGSGVSININLGHTSNTEPPAIDVTPLNDKD